MKIIYHPTSPAPAIPETDAVFQDIAALNARFGGRQLNLYPLPFPTRWFPPQLLGTHCIAALKRSDSEMDLHHVFHALPRVFPVLRSLHKPVVYSVVAGLSSMRRLPGTSDLRSIAAWITAAPADAQRLMDAGASCCRVIKPGMDLSGFAQVPLLPRSEPFTLLAASAPWTPGQFRQKGFDLLFAVLASRPDLRLILLWRGFLEKDLRKRIKKSNATERVEIINRRIDVTEALGRCHAAVVLAEHSRLVKAYPHSLIEAMAAGRPVLASKCIPIADFIEQTGAGETLAGLEQDEFLAALDRLRARYDQAAKAARNAAALGFSMETMLDSYQKLYKEVIS